MRVWGLGAVLFLAVAIAGCGGNSTAVGVTVSAAGVAAGTTATVLENQTLQFAAAITGGGAANWQICLPATKNTIEPTDCTAIPGITVNGATVLSGYGTITQTGLYTAPPAIPSPNSFLVLASNSATDPNNSTTFGTMNVQVNSGIRVQLTPSTATVATSGTVQFTKTVTGTTNTAVTWSVNGTVGGNVTVGYICPNPLAACTADGEYFAPPAAPGQITITAASVADPSETGTASVTVAALAAPVATSIDPTTSERGAAQQDVYISGQNFLSNSVVYAIPPGQAPTAVPTTFISGSLLRATIPGSAMTTAGALPLLVQGPTAGASGQVSLNLLPVRPGLIEVTPDTATQSASGTNVSLVGGFFAPGSTSVQFNGAALVPAVTNSRQLTVSLPSVATPGLYPITVTNAGISGGQASSASLNVSISPLSVPTAPISSVSVGSNPSAVAIDYAAGTAIVTNKGNGTSPGTASILNIAVNPPVVLNTIPVGVDPTGVAVDDLLTPHVALVVNSVDQTVSTINLTTQTVTGTLSVAIGPTTGSPAGNAPLPFSVGINPLTHRALVAYESFNETTILDISTGTPVVVEQLGGDVTAGIATGTAPGIAVDPRLNWVVITPGGSGIQTTSIVDLGHNAGFGDTVARAPGVIAGVSVAATGAGINSQTHEVLFTDFSASSLASYRLLDNAVTNISFTSNGIPITQLGYGAAAADSLTNIGIAVNGLSAIATLVNLETGVVLGNVTLPAGPAQAVAIDPASNEAIVVSQPTSTVSVLALGPTAGAINPLQIVEASPEVAFTSSTPLTMTLTGSGFTGVSTVLVDGTSLTPSSVSSNGRQLVVSVPANMLGSARRYAVQVQTGSAVSNVSDLTVAQAIPVGIGPVGVAVDTDRDLAVVTNSGSGTVSLVALTPTTPSGTNQTPFGSVGTMGPPLTVGLNPLGVAVLPRLGLALVANNGSNNVSLVDLTQTIPPQTVTDCLAGDVCTGQTGVAIDQDNASAVVTNSTSNNSIANNNSNNVSYVGLTGVSGSVAQTVTPESVAAVDLDPTAVAIDPLITALNPGVGYAAVTTASQASSVEFLTAPGGTFVDRFLGLQLPMGIVFDPVNQVFLAANSLLNDVVILNPTTLSQSSIPVGINPTALDYDYQTSTVVTVNRASNTISLLDYVCPPPAAGVTSICPNPMVQAVLGFGGSQQFSVAVDAKLNLAVVADQNNNRLLLLPLPY